MIINDQGKQMTKSIDKTFSIKLIGHFLIQQCAINYNKRRWLVDGV